MSKGEVERVRMVLCVWAGVLLLSNAYVTLLTTTHPVTQYIMVRVTSVLTYV